MELRRPLDRLPARFPRAAGDEQRDADANQDGAKDDASEECVHCLPPTISAAMKKANAQQPMMRKMSTNVMSVTLCCVIQTCSLESRVT